VREARLVLLGVGIALLFAGAGFSRPSVVPRLSQNSTKLVPPGVTGAAAFGWDVAVSADGTTALVGGPSDVPGGAAWIFVRSGGTWTEQAKLTQGGAGNRSSGLAVALSADGNTAAIGCVSGGVGAVCVYTRTGTTWSAQGSALIPWNAHGGFGFAVALSSDGNTLLASDPSDYSYTGGAWVFSRSGGTWTQEGPKLVASDEPGFDSFGWSVALSADGSTALIGGLGDNSNQGAVWMFAPSGGVWTQQGSRVTPGRQRPE
jgi:hypothetical protein